MWTLHIHTNGMSRKARGVREALRMAVGRGVQGQILNPRRNMDYTDSCSITVPE